MSLFVGNISRNVRVRDLEEEFEHFGKCEVNSKVSNVLIIQGSYAFVEFQDEKDAQDALDALQGKSMGGLKITIEWSKKSGRFDPRDSKRPPRYSLPKQNLERIFLK